MYEHGFNMGYFKACLDIYNYLESAYKTSFGIRAKSKKQSQNFTISLLRYIASNYDARELFRKYGGDVVVALDPKTLEVKDIKESEWVIKYCYW